MDKIIDFLVIITLTLSGIYLAYKVPDVIINGFEHGNNIYIQLPEDYYEQPTNESKNAEFHGQDMVYVPKLYESVWQKNAR
jgi:hypothetical protein